jgi:lipoprotein-anchoring transpeptidase ErfK/SrfK
MSAPTSIEATVTATPRARIASPRFRPQRMAIALLVVVLVVAPITALAAPQGGSYVVEQGDTLAGIAARMGVYMWDLAEANGIQNVNLIHAGQVLAAPGESPAAATVADWGSSDPRWIEVDVSEQWLTAYEGGTPVFGAPVSTAGPGYSTPRGEFAIQVKYRWTYMAGADYYYDDVPCAMYFADYLAIHGTYWHNDFGTPASHGCVNIAVPNACWLFDWASVGTGVWIHD